MPIAEKFEYRIIVISLGASIGDLIKVQVDMNEFGKDGFRFISSFLLRDSYAVLFSRPVKAEIGSDNSKSKSGHNSAS